MRRQKLAEVLALARRNPLSMSRERRYRPLSPRRHVMPLSDALMQLRLSMARAHHTVDASLEAVSTSNMRIEKLESLAGIARRKGQATVSIEEMNNAIACAGASPVRQARRDEIGRGGLFR